MSTQDLNARSVSSTSRLVYDLLRADIMRGVFDMGERLNEGQLAQRYGVGKTPVREALGALVREELVEVEPRVGYRTSRMSLQDLEDAFELREIAEAAAAEKAAINIGEEDLERLEQLDRHLHPDNQRVFLGTADDNAQFHSIVAEASGNRQLAKVVRRSVEQIHRLIILRLDLKGDNLCYHRDLVDALRGKDPAKARSSMLADIDITKQIVLRSLRKLKANWQV